MNSKCGIIGLPYAGKSTLFKALTNLKNTIINHSYNNIKLNNGIVQILDSRLYELTKIINPKYTVMATMEFINITGITKITSNKIHLEKNSLKNIYKSKVIIHIIRCFERYETPYFSEKISPAKDIDLINTEFILIDLDICERTIYLINKNINFNNKLKLLILKKCETHLNNGNVLRTLYLSNKEINIIYDINFITLKPTIYIANINEYTLKKDIYLEEISTIAAIERSLVITIYPVIELNFLKKNKEKEKIIIKKIEFEKTILNHIISLSYNLLDLHTFFTIGKKEVRAWSIPKGATALQAASKIHSEFEKKFIRAQVISFTNFIIFKGEEGAKKAGKIFYKNKNYIVKDGDIIKFLCN